MEEEMELLKNLISIEQRLQNLKKRKKECGNQTIHFVRADDSGSKKNKNQAANNSKRKRTKDTTTNKKAKATIEQITQNTFPYNCRYSSLFPGTLQESSPDQEYYASLLSYNESAEADFTLERLAYIIHNHLDLRDMSVLRQRPRFAIAEDCTSLEIERSAWTNNILKRAYEHEQTRVKFFPESNTLFKPYMSYESCHKLLNLKPADHEKVFEGLNLYPGQLLHMPFSVEEQIVLLNFLEERNENEENIDASICARLAGRNLVSIQLFLDDFREGKDQYEFPIEYSIPNINSKRDRKFDSILAREEALASVNNQTSPFDHNNQWSFRNAQHRSASNFISGNIHIGQFDRHNNLVAASDSNTNNVVLCSIEKAKSFVHLKNHRKGVNDIRFSCHNRFIVTGAADAAVNVYCANTGLNIASFVYGESVGHKDAVNSIAMHPYDERYFISSGKDCKLFLWDIERKQYIATLPSYNNDEKHITREFTQICYGSNASSDWLFGLSKISGTDIGEIGIFDMRCLDYSKPMQNQQPIRVKRITESGASISSFTVSHNGLLLANGCSNGLVRLYDIRLESKSSSLKEIDNKPAKLQNKSSNHAVSFCSFSSDDRYLCTSSTDSVHYVYDLRKSCQPILRLEHSKMKSRFAATSSWSNIMGSSLLATAGSDKVVSLWNPASPSSVQVNEFDIGANIYFLQFNHDDTSLALGTDKGLILYSTNNIKRLDE